jgi:hypothetical protein
MLQATTEHYKEFLEGAIWADLLLFFQECLDVNRDLLEGILSFKEGARIETDDALRGRNWQIRDIIAYVKERAEFND